jgi:hypothetical protein
MPKISNGTNPIIYKSHLKSACCIPSSLRILACSEVSLSPFLQTVCAEMSVTTPFFRAVGSPRPRSCGSSEWGNCSSGPACVSNSVKSALQARHVPSLDYLQCNRFLGHSSGPGEVLRCVRLEVVDDVLDVGVGEHEPALLAVQESRHAVKSIRVFLLLRETSRPLAILHQIAI